MAEKGRNPAISIWGRVWRYQGRGGISRGYLVVRQGALNSACGAEQMSRAVVG